MLGLWGIAKSRGMIEHKGPHAKDPGLCHKKNINLTLQVIVYTTLHTPTEQTEGLFLSPTHPRMFTRTWDTMGWWYTRQ